MVDKSVECMQWNGMGRDGKTKQGDRDLGRHLFIQALTYLTSLRRMYRRGEETL
jgi:hypothetical protein